MISQHPGRNHDSFDHSTASGALVCYYACMKRTTISIPDELALLAEREAHRRSISVSAVAREALIDHLGLSGKKKRHLPFASLGSSGKRNTARQIEKILDKEWGK